MKTIVVGYDDTEPAQRALIRAGQLAKAFDSKVIVASVARKLVPGPHSTSLVDPADSPELHREELKHAEALLAEQGIEAEFELAVGDPAREITRVGRDRDADLVVVGTSEPNVIRRLLGQSVSGAVQRKSHRDVLIVH